MELSGCFVEVQNNVLPFFGPSRLATVDIALYSHLIRHFQFTLKVDDE